MARATPGILAYNPAYRGSTLGALKAPRGFQGMQDILKSEAGYYATLPGIAYLANKYGLEEDTVKDFILSKMSEAEARDKGLIIPPDPTVSEEERKQGVTSGGFTQTPVDPREGVLDTPVDDPPTFEDMTGGGGFTQIPADPRAGMLDTPTLTEKEKDEIPF